MVGDGGASSPPSLAYFLEVDIMGLRNMCVGLITVAPLVSVGAFLNPLPTEPARRASIEVTVPQPPRWAALDRVVFDVSISLGARHLYTILDRTDKTGRIRIKQDRLVALLGVSRREFHRCLSELRGKGYLSVVRHQTIAEYALFWVYSGCATGGISDGLRCATGGTSDVPRAAHLEAPHHIIFSHDLLPTIDRPSWRLTLCAGCGDPAEGTDRQRCRCGLIHDASSVAAIDPVAQAQAWLFRAGQGLAVPLGPADPEIALRALIAAKGPVRLYHEIRELVLSGRAAEARSYAWFVTVVGNRVAA